MIYGLLGENISHSFSPLIHKNFGDYKYKLFDMQKEEIENFIKKEDIGGFNITMPYKKEIMQYCKTISDKAKKIGCVNTVVYDEFRNLHGYNTDYDGFLYLLEKNNIDVYNKNIAILGNGSTSKTVYNVLKDLQAKSIIKISRSGDIGFKDIEKFINIDILINTTPVGMYPNCPDSLIDLENFPNVSTVIDIIYNPIMTKLLIDAYKRGLNYVNGLDMLIAQGKVASELFQKKSISNELLNKTVKGIKRDNSNIIIIGMPGSGKSSIGRNLAKNLNREFIDIDKEIEKNQNMSIPNIFKNYGEQYFRNIEKEMVEKVGKLQGKVISTGGGVIIDSDNYYPLKQNGVIFNITRHLDNLSSKGRPLSQGGRDKIYKLYNERKDNYDYFKDFNIENRYFKYTVKEIQEKYYEYFNN